MRWISTENGAALVAVALLCAAAATAEEAAPQRFDAQALAGWAVWGAGDATLSDDGRALVLREGEDSKGVNLVSPEPLPRHLRARLRLTPEQAEGVVVVMLSAAKTDGSALAAPEGYLGEQSLWKAGDVGSYAFAFHTGYHQPNAFVASNPGWQRLVEVPDVVTGERTVDVEVGRSAEKLWLLVDGTLAFRVPVPEPGLPAGHLVVRLRGPGDGSFSTRIESLEVEALD